MIDGPRFEPWERLMLLSHAIEEVPADGASAVLEPITTASMCVVRQLMGQKTKAVAYASVERARAAIEEARRA